MPGHRYRHRQSRPFSRQSTGNLGISGAAEPARFAEITPHDRQFPARSPSTNGNIPRDSDLARYSL